MKQRLVIITALSSIIFATAASAQWVACSDASVTCTNSLVGVGNTNPIRNVVISGPGSATFQLSTLGGGATAIDGFQFQQVGKNSNLINEQNGFMAFYTNATQRVTLDITGRR